MIVKYLECYTVISCIVKKKKKSLNFTKNSKKSFHLFESEQVRDYSIHLHLVSRSHTAEQLTTFHALLLHQTKIDIVLGVAARRRHGKQCTRQLYRKTRRNRLRVEEFLSSLEHPPPSRQEKEGSNQIKRGNEEDQVWHRPTFKRDQSMITPRA